jgi:hypothetical protein
MTPRRIAVITFALVIAGCSGQKTPSSTPANGVERVPRNVAPVLNCAKAAPVLDCTQALDELRAHASAIASDETRGMFLSGAGPSDDSLSRKLLAAGYVTCTGRDLLSGRCELTAKGRAQYWRTENFPAYHIWRVVVPLAEIVVDKVTGIRLVGNGQRVVDFNYHVKPLPFGKAVFGEDWASGTKTGQAAFVKLSNGWRIDRILRTTEFRP